jgi:hypothetical protein
MHYPVPACPLEGYAFAGRDGSPSRPFVCSGPYLIRLNGGLGEPALPNAEAYYPVSL